MRANGISSFDGDLAETGILQWKRPGCETVRFDVRTVFPDFDAMTDCQQRTIVNGFKQKIADSGALKDATPTAKMSAMFDTADRLAMLQQWNSGTRASIRTVNVEALVVAIAATLGKPADAVAEIVAGWSVEQMFAQSVAERYRAEYIERLPKPVARADTATLDAELDAL